MNKYALCFVSLLLIVLLFAFSGCNSKKNDEINSETVASAQTTTDSQTAVSTESLVASDSSESTDVPEVNYSKEEDELEIMTLPGNYSDGSDEDSPATSSEAETTSAPDAEVYEPTFLPNGESIELPFIPAK